MYFKANYPAEYMAAVMSHNMSDIKKVASFIEECHRLGIEVDPPNINTARGKFVAKDGRVQYGMSAIKGVGSSAIKQIVEERESKGLFKSIFDFAARIDSRVCNRRTLESLIAAGAFDELNDNRAELMMGVEDILQYGARKQEEERLSQVNMFGGDAGGAMSQEPKLKPVPKWSSIERLNNERELIGFYLSGHPLTKYEEDIKLFGSQNLSDESMNKLRHESTIRFIAIITSKRQATDKKGRPIAFLQVEDLHSSMELAVFSKQFDQFSALLEVDNVVFISGKFVKRERGDSVIVNNIERVENLREKHQDNLNLKLQIDTATIDNDILDRMETLLTTNRGSTMVKMLVHSKEANGPIRMNMRNFVVDPNPELMKGLREVLGEESVELVKGSS
jgi:DNA polymerase-3 subunit alpha